MTAADLLPAYDIVRYIPIAILAAGIVGALLIVASILRGR